MMMMMMMSMTMRRMMVDSVWSQVTLQQEARVLQSLLGSIAQGVEWFGGYEG